MERNYVMALAAALNMSDDMPLQSSVWAHDVNHARKQHGEYHQPTLPVSCVHAWPRSQLKAHLILQTK